MPPTSSPVTGGSSAEPELRRTTLSKSDIGNLKAKLEAMGQSDVPSATPRAPPGPPPKIEQSGKVVDLGRDWA